MLVVDPGDHHRIDLAEDAALGEHFEALQLAVGQKLGGLDAGVALVLPEHPGVDLGADLGIDHVDGDGDVIDVEPGNGVNMIGQRQPVGRQTQLDVGRGLGDQLERLEGLLGIGERIAGAGDTEHGHLRDR